MIVYLDSDVLIDVLLNREPHATLGSRVMELSEKGDVRLITSPLCIANTHYMISKAVGSQRSKTAIRDLLNIVELADMPGSVVTDALSSTIIDFEDAMQIYTASLAKADVILTRNVRDYKQSVVPSMTPSQFLATIP
jgi:predicted nucleic acid-binding protein